MAGKIIADTIESSGSQISLNVGNLTILTASSTGLTLIPTTNVNVNLTNSIVTLTNGSATSPGLTFSGNTRTGLFMPSANTLAFTAANTESMRIDSSGNVGIGTNNPSRSKLVISAAVSQISLTDADGTSNIVDITKLTASAGIAFSGNGTERMRITSAGKVGIGNSSPDAQNLHVGGGAGGGSINGYTRLAIEASDYAVTTFKAPAANFSQIIFADPTSSNLGGINYFNSSQSTPNAMTFLTGGGNERMRIDTNGAVLINTTSTFGLGGLFFVKNASGPIGSFSCQNSATALGFGNQSGTATYNAIYFYTNAYGTNVGGIAVNSASTSYNTTSDYRLKESILPMTGALARVSALKPVTYKWKPDDSDGEGFIAHELAEVCPHAVTGEKDAVDEKGDPKYQQVDVSFLVATLTAAIQELKAIVDAQAVEIAALKAK